MQPSNDDALNQSLEWLLEEEGGWSDNKADSGGKTMYGVTQATYDTWRAASGKVKQTVRNITKDEAYQLYRVMYWNAAGCDRLPWPLSYMTFDACVNSGPNRAVRWLQAALKVTQDSKVGPGTLKAAQDAANASDGVIIFRVIDQRLQFLVDLIRKVPSQIEFLNGWMRRLLRVQLRASLTMEGLE